MHGNAYEGGGRGRSIVALAATVAALGFALLASSSASAGEWTVTQLDHKGDILTILWGASCPSEELCVVTGTDSTIAVSTNPTGGASAWDTIHPEGSLEFGGGGRYPGNAIRDVSCPSTALCVAAGPQGHLFVSTHPTGGLAAWRLVDLGLEATRMNGISCPTPSLCVAVANNGKVITSRDPNGTESSWSVVQMSDPTDLRDVSCPTTNLCVAVDLAGNVLSSTDPAGGPSAWGVAARPAGGEPLNGIDCPSPALCVTADAGEIITSTGPPSGDWVAASAGTGLPVQDFSCPSVSACAAVDNNADAIVSTDPTGGSAAWSFTNVIPAPSSPVGRPNGMFGISCPSRSLCVAAGQDRQVMVSTDPFAALEPGAGARRGSRGGVRGPRVSLTWHPRRWSKPRRGGRRVAFRFRTIGSAARVVCRLDRRRARRCGSPQRYRVGRGNHVFRAVAISPSGKRGPVRAFRFAISRRPPRWLRRPRVRLTWHPPKRLDPRKGGRVVAFRFRGSSRAVRFACRLDDRRPSACKSPRRYRVGKGKHRFRVVAVAASGLRSSPRTVHFRVGPIEEGSPVGTCRPGQESDVRDPCLTPR